MNSSRLSVSVVIPCLNEEKTLPLVLTKLNELAQTDWKERTFEVLVSDNGSTDRSVAVAEGLGARVVHCPEKGYGAALKFGIQNARNEVVIFGDADNTYDFLEAPRMVSALERGDYDMVVGSRLDGVIHDGAMPLLHRYLGTPVLTFFINFLHGHSDSRLTDCNSGFRCFKKTAFDSWKVTSPGMEFASEMLVKSLKARARISQVPISLRPSPKERTPHLKTWRDGMRHLLQIFLEKPAFFNQAGLLVWTVSWLILALGAFHGALKLGPFSIFGMHSMILAMAGSFLGLSIWGIGLFLRIQAAGERKQSRVYQYLIDVPEGHLFWYSTAILAASFGAFLWLFVNWMLNGFQYLSLESQTLAIMTLGTNGVLLVTQMITAHLLKRHIQ